MNDVLCMTCEDTGVVVEERASLTEGPAFGDPCRACSGTALSRAGAKVRRVRRQLAGLDAATAKLTDPASVARDPRFLAMRARALVALRASEAELLDVAMPEALAQTRLAPMVVAPLPDADRDRILALASQPMPLVLTAPPVVADCAHVWRVTRRAPTADHPTWSYCGLCGAVHPDGRAEYRSLIARMDADAARSRAAVEEARNAG